MNVQVFEASPNSSLGGIFGPLSGSELQTPNMYITLENAASIESHRSERRTAVLLRFDGERLVEVQRIDLMERSRSLPSSFALGPAVGSVCCAVWGGERLHELVRADIGEQIVFKQISKWHSMPSKMYAIAGFEAAGERRLAVSCFDNSLRVFHWGRLGPLELSRLQKAADFWLPTTLASVPDCDLLIVANGKNSAAGEWQTALELFNGDASGNFSGPRRLLPADSALYIWTMLLYRNPVDKRLQAVLYDGNSRCLKSFDFV